MSQRREVEARLALYDDLSGILGAMRSFALTELRRINKREVAQQQVVQSLSVALQDIGNAFLSQNDPIITDSIWLVFGSVRGFCGSFNEDVLAVWRAEADSHSPLILVGERLHGRVDEQPQQQRVSGAEGGLDALSAIERILAAISAIRDASPQALGIVACLRDEQGARSQQLWPLPNILTTSSVNLPFSYLPIAEVAAGVAEHYLFHSLLALLFRSIRVENHMRLIQMETALRYLEHGGEELQAQRNRLRQEEIVEEIELMVARQ
jgi:F-type H+-transporting ATPase subunit gamma